MAKLSKENADKARRNGALGGRPKGFAALEAERQRIFVAKELKKHFAPIVKRAIIDAKTGNKAARDWLSEFAFGKPTQPISGVDGESLLPGAAEIAAARKALEEL